MAHRVASLAIIALIAAPTRGDSASREAVNFDFGWRHFLGSVSSRTCGGIEKGVNYGTGGTRKTNIPDAGTCCDDCAASTVCIAWDWNPESKECWLKSDNSTFAKQDRYSGTIKASSVPSPASKTDYDDSKWQLVDAPHDMLLHQNYSEDNGASQAFLPRNEGWYRKHFTLPKDWEGSAVWFYTEGIFHVATAWLNGQPIGQHLAGYTSFAMRLDNVTGVKFGGENVLAVHVDATFGSGWWYEGGGLSRHQYLVRTDIKTSLGPDGSQVFAFAPPSDIKFAAEASNPLVADSASLRVEASVTNYESQMVGSANEDKISARFSLYDADGGVAAPAVTSEAKSSPAPGSKLTLTSDLKVSDVQIWSVPRPYLYTLTTEILRGDSVVDTINTSSIGFRTINFSPETGLALNGQRVKVRGFCDHSNFGGVGSAVPDRVNFFRAQVLRSIGGNAWRMAHNPPIPARLDMTDALGILVLDENRDYGGGKQQGGISKETSQQQVDDMGDLVQRDRNRASVFAWSFCNEVGCNNESAARPFRQESYLFDGTRPVTQNHLGTSVSTQYLDVQGFSHKSGDVFDRFHSANPDKPTMATECCSCLSQRGVDQDMCPNPRSSDCREGCHVDCNGTYSGQDTNGEFYNNEISQCTASQVNYSDSREFVAGTFVWSGFDYLGESRGWPQTVKCRGAIADVAGFYKESSGWLRAWWLANIPTSDAGRPAVETDTKYTVYVPESWVPVGGRSNRTIHVYSNAPSVALLVNGKQVTDPQSMEFFGTATFGGVPFSAGNLTAVAMDDSGNVVASATKLTPGTATSVRISVDAPSPKTGTGSALVNDGEDTAMVRAEIVDSEGRLVTSASNTVTFKVISGPGRVLSTHSGEPATQVPAGSPSHPAYKGLVRAYVRSTQDSATSPQHRARLAEIDSETADVSVVAKNAPAATEIVVEASAEGLQPARVSIPVTDDLSQLPKSVAAAYGRGQLV